MTDKPEVVVLCGSTRFMEAFHGANQALTLQGKIVLTVAFPKSELEHLKNRAVVEERLDELHLRKIDLADEVVVLSIGGYIGESTAKEIRYAEGLSKPISYWDQEDIDAK